MQQILVEMKVNGLIGQIDLIDLLFLFAIAAILITVHLLAVAVESANDGLAIAVLVDAFTLLDDHVIRPGHG